MEGCVWVEVAWVEDCVGCMVKVWGLCGVEVCGGCMVKVWGLCGVEVCGGCMGGGVCVWWGGERG